MLARADRLKLAAQSTAVPTPPLIAPVKGWNTRDALDAMDPADAILLDNFYPDANGVNVRNGYSLYSSGLGAASVATLAEYNAGSTRKFLAACNGHIWDITSGASPSSLASGFGSDVWQTASFLSRTFFANGTDTLQVYNGSTVANSTFTGVTLSTLVGVAIYQQRLFLWANNSTGFWFAPLNSITGALSFFDLAAYAPHGGNLTAAVTFSHDGGNGVLDFMAFMMSSGDCLVYYGNDPSDVNNWQLIGIYRISPPVGPRAVCNYGAEAFATTFDDHVSLQAQLVALTQGRLPPRSKVSTAVQAAVNANSAAAGWQALFYPAGRRLIFNIPNSDGSFSQHVQNTGVTYIDPLTGQPSSPWCRFQNMPAVTWGLFNNALYFGAAGGKVYQADTGTLDVLGTIAAQAQQSWNMFQDPSRKQFTAMRPIVSAAGGLAFTAKLGFDYGPLNISVAATTPAGGSPWDTSPWDTSPWSPEQQVSTLWHAAGGAGVAVSVGLNVASSNGATWLRTDMRMQRGQAL